jgi:hypothetical protein
MTNGPLTLLLSGLLGLFVGALFIQVSVWEVDVFVYLLFSASFFVLVGSSFLKQRSVFFSLTNLFLFFGFWGKTTSHMVQGTPFLEAAGGFSIEHLNQAMLESGVIALLLTLVELGLRFHLENFQNKFKNFKIMTSNWPDGTWAMLFWAIVVLVLAMMNWRIGFLRVGLASDTHVPSPFSILYSWILGPGAATVLFYFVRRQMSWMSVIAVSASMAAIGIATLSRNSLMYFAFPIAYIVISQYWKILRGSLFAFFTGAVFVLSMIQITQLRMEAGESFPEVTSAPDLSRTQTQMKELFLDRWIGIEGLIVARANRSDDTFKVLVQEDARKNPTSLYRSLSQSSYPIPGKFLYYTFPGPIGLIGFAQTVGYQLVGIGVFIFFFSLLYFSSEIFFTDSQKYVVAWWMASNITQVSLFPKYNFAIICIYLLFMISITLCFNYIYQLFFIGRIPGTQNHE